MGSDGIFPDRAILESPKGIHGVEPINYAAQFSKVTRFLLKT